MKNLLILITIMVAGCATPLTPEQKQKRLRDSVLGEYELKLEDGTTHKHVLLENGIVEWYNNGNKLVEYKWSIVDGEIHVEFSSEFIRVFRINPDKSITLIAGIRDGKRTDRPKEHHITLKKIK